MEGNASKLLSDPTFLGLFNLCLCHMLSFSFFRYQLSTHGETTPPGTSGACAVVVNHVMYVFGGLVVNGSTNEAWALDLRTRRWLQIKIESDLQKPSPRDRFAAWEHDN